LKRSELFRGNLPHQILGEDAAIIAITWALRETSKPGFKRTARLDAYVGRCAVTAALRVRERNNREILRPREVQTHALPYRLKLMERLAIREAIERCLSTIEPPERRQVVILCVIERRTQREAAAMLGVSLGSINEWLNVAKPAFRICILCSGVYRPRLKKGDRDDD
jgi:DNA-directed RNA polymerase specialized sigma24 family protein